MEHKKIIDESINIDLSRMPKSILEIINELEEFEKKGDDFSYDLKFYELDSVAKSHMLAGHITENDFYKIEEKYGGILND